MKIKCDICKKAMTRPGGLAFSPPYMETNNVSKYHICVDCWQNRILKALLFRPGQHPHDK